MKDNEIKELNDCKNTALHYKTILEKLIVLDFNNPNEYLTNFSKENNVNLKDKDVQNNFLKIRDEYIKKINDFYDKNFVHNNSKYINKEKNSIKYNKTQKKFLNNNNSNIETENSTARYKIFIIIILISILTISYFVIKPFTKEELYEELVN